MLAALIALERSFACPGTCTGTETPGDISPKEMNLFVVIVELLRIQWAAFLLPTKLDHLPVELVVLFTPPN